MWRITAWDRDAGLGEIESEHFGRLPFGAAVADANDFVVGEAVLAEVTDKERVERVRVVEPRYVPVSPCTVRAPPLLPSLAKTCARSLAQFVALAGSSTELPLQDCRFRTHCVPWQLEGSDRCLLDTKTMRAAVGTVRGVLIVEDGSYADAPPAFGVERIRLSTDSERDYLHQHRIALEATLAALTIRERTLGDDEPRFFFLVARGLRYRAK